MENTGRAAIKLIGSEVCGSMLPLNFASHFSDRFLFDLYNTAKIHDVAHIVGSALINNNIIKGRAAENIFQEQIYVTLLRHENQCFAFEKLCGVLENSKIPYIPLKGAVIKSLYPQTWQRTGCDIDILVHEKDVEKAAAAITEKLGYTQTGRGKHDISILSTENFYVELHFSLLEEDTLFSVAKVLRKVWDYAKPAENGKFRYELDDEMLYFYHIAHMAKHFTDGGCGIRPFLDLWLMDRSKKYNTEEAKALLKKGKLSDFEKNAKRLSKVWFSGEEHDDVTLLAEKYIFDGGCFGSRETKMISEQHKYGGRVKYILSRIFVPYDDLKGQYPIIKNYRFLTPICEICRLFSLLFGKKKKFRKEYIGDLMNFSDEHIDFLFKSMGL